MSVAALTSQGQGPKSTSETNTTFQGCECTFSITMTHTCVMYIHVLYVRMCTYTCTVSCTHKTETLCVPVSHSFSIHQVLCHQLTLSHTRIHTHTQTHTHAHAHAHTHTPTIIDTTFPCIQKLYIIAFLLSAVPSMPSGLVEESKDHDFISLSWMPPDTPYGIVETYRVAYEGFKDESLIGQVRTQL